MSRAFNYEIAFTTNSESDLVYYTNFNYTRFIDNQKYTGDHIFMLSDRLLFHQSKLQSTITLLSSKAEYMVMVEGEKKVL